MILNITALLLIVLLTLYLANQGALTAILSLVTATFGSFIAMAYFETAGGLFVNWRPEYARGCGFLLLYLLTFGLIRLIADVAVPKTAKLPKWPDHLAGGFAGFFAAMIVVGNLIIGVEMLPLGTRILGFDRFPTEQRMTPDGYGQITGSASVWLAPERFVTGMWSLASGGSMGGAKAFAQEHPDILTESYGYRNTVQPGANTTLIQSMAKLRGIYEVADAKTARTWVGSDADMRVIVVRVQTEMGEKAPTRAADADSHFRITPTQVRLVASKGGRMHQYYPIGYMDMGTTFVPLSLATGHLVDDFPSEELFKKAVDKSRVTDVDANKPSIVHDWVFAILPEEKPDFIEVKQHTRFDLKLPEKAVALSTIDPTFYSPHIYRKNPAVITVSVSRVNAFDKSKSPIVKADIWLLMPVVPRSHVLGLADVAYDKLDQISKDYSDNTGGWGDVIAREKNLPSSNDFRIGARHVRENVKLLKGLNEEVIWSNFLIDCLLSEMTPRPAQNVDVVNRYFDDTIVPLFNSSKTVVERTGTGTDGLVPIKVAKGSYVVVVRVKNADGLYFWVRVANAGYNEKVPLNLLTEDADFKVELKKPN